MIIIFRETQYLESFFHYRLKTTKIRLKVWRQRKVGLRSGNQKSKKEEEEEESQERNDKMAGDSIFKKIINICS